MDVNVFGMGYVGLIQTAAPANIEQRVRSMGTASKGLRP
jgi:UDP-glucose 6-dehydrogenase